MKSYKHIDNRRTLIEWIADSPIRSCKVVIAKGDTEVGNHYHLLKDEYFYLLSGEGEYKLGDDDFKSMIDVVFVPKGLRHTFKLKEGSVLLGAASEPFDVNDEIT